MSELKKPFFRSRNDFDKSLSDSLMGQIAKKHSDNLVDFLAGGAKSVKNFAGRHATKTLLIGALGTGIYYIPDNIKSSVSSDNQIENVVEINEKANNDFWDLNPAFFDKSFMTQKLERETIAPGVDVIRDVGFTFYIVKAGDTKEKIRKKLSEIPEFSYLSRAEYDTKIQSFNVPGDVVKSKANAQGYSNNFYIPIPLNSDVRTFSPQDFAFYAKQGIDDIKEHPIYGKDIKKLLRNCSEEELVVAMVAFARSETAADYTTFTTPIGATEFHRWEEHMKAFSFTPYHILMEKNADGKTSGPGLKARLDLQMTEGQTYHPRNATALFLAYWCNKMTNGRSLKDYFPITPNNIVNVSNLYNGSKGYSKKLEPNYLYALDVLGVSSQVWSNERQEFNSNNVSVGGFSFERVSTDGKKVYSYVIKSGGNPGGVKSHFKNQYPSYSGGIDVVKKDGEVYADNTWIEKGTTVYVKIKN